MARPTNAKQDLLPRIAEVFRERGYEGATVSELSRVTGLGKASLYHHFPGGKSEMAGALVRYAIEELDQCAFRHLAGHAQWPERLERLIDGFSDYAQGGKSDCLLAVLAVSQPSGDFAAEIRSQMRVWLRATARAYAEAGHHGKGARRHARELLVSLYGALVIARLMGGTKPFSQTVRRLTRELKSSARDQPRKNA